ncbi:MAG TPA: type II CAAX endopeptidase family protein [Anaerolineales bacterium]|jgi:membrane protease YdiL (CAAX protease family)|nr:type II CAAX endopeptidase family protein [Anaerolineales bacterium]
MSEIQPTRERSTLTRIFLSPDEPRLRAGWRLLIQTVLYLGLQVLFFLVLILLFGPIGQSTRSIPLQILNFLATTISVFVARRWLDKRSIESLGLKLDAHTWLDILAGIAISLIQMGFIYVAMLGLGWLTFEGFAWEIDPLGIVISNVFFFFVIFIFVGWDEELLSRGYHLQTLAGGLNLFWAVVLSSAVFGLLHLANPNATWVSAAGIFLAGLFLAYGYIRTRQLWLPIGLHIGWNFFEGVGFGFPVSGLEDIYKLLRIQVHGPEIWTGGAFGPEAGLIVVPALLLGALLIYLYTAQRKT